MLRKQILSIWLDVFTPLRGARVFRSLELVFSSPCGGRVTFFCLVQKKVTKEKHAPRRRRLRRFPPVLGKAGRRINSAR